MRSLIANLRDGRSESQPRSRDPCRLILSSAAAVLFFCAFNRVLRPVGRIAVTPQSRTREYGRSFTSGRSAMKWSLILFLSLASYFTHAETGSLVGVWQIQSTVYDGEEQPIRTPEQIKIFTEEHVFYTYYDPNLGTAEPLLSVGHGTYTLNDGTLSETIVNHSNTALIGETFSVSVELSEDGNTFQQIVDLGKYVLEERWVRVE